MQQSTRTTSGCNISYMVDRVSPARHRWNIFSSRHYIRSRLLSPGTANNKQQKQKTKTDFLSLHAIL